MTSSAKRAGATFETRPYRWSSPDDFWSRVDMNPHHCWEWQGAVSSNGYGNLSWRGKRTSPHRVAFSLTKGEISEGLVVDHVCRNRICVNPDHLEAVTQQENVQRYARLVTHCPAGHEYSEENTRHVKGRRLCVECGRKDARDRSRRKKGGI